jgi:hypothetical protein
MMKENNIKRSIFRFCTIGIFTALTLSFSGCEKNEKDTQPPKIILIQPNEGQAFSVGTDFLVVTVMHDYVALASYRYKVYWFDDPSNVSDNPNDPTFEFEQSNTISTNDIAPHWEDVNFKIDIPVGIRKGYYNLDIYCYDQAGNFDSVGIRLMFQD